MLNYVKQAIASRFILGSARLIGDSFFVQLERVRRLVHSVLRSLSRGWAFFKDIHFGWYVLVPVVSSSSAFGETAAILAWGGIAMLALALVTFVLIDSILRGNGDEHRIAAAPRTSLLLGTSATSHRARANYEPLQSRLTRDGLRRNAMRRPGRTRTLRA